MRRTPQMRCRSCLLALLAATLAAGCDVNRTAQQELDAAVRRYAHAPPTDADRYVAGVPAAPANQPGTTTRPATAPASVPAAPRTLREYVRVALAENPEIKAAFEAARARFERVAQVTSLPDPLLSMKVMPEPVRTAEGDNYFVLGIQQKLPVPEKLSRAGRVALDEARMALEALEATRLRVIADVKRAYFRLYVIDRTIEIDRANQDLLRGLIEAARGQVATGRRSQEDVLRAQVELYNLESQIVRLTQQRQTVAAALNRLLNRAPQTPVPSPEPFGLRSVDVQVDRLLRIAARENPELKRLRRQIERDRERIALAKLAYWPDFTLGVQWIQVDPRGAFEPLPNPQTGIRPSVPQLSEEGSDNWAITLSLNVPVWVERIRAGIREARRRLLASQHALVGTQNRVEFQIADALARVQAARELAELFAGTIIPQARQAYEVSRSAYITGRSDFQFVIDNWQKWLIFTIQYHRSLGELERSIADLEEALGVSLNEATR